MNRAFILSPLLISLIALTACQTTPFYTAPKPQIAKTAPSAISNQTLEIPLSGTERLQALEQQQAQNLPPVKIGLLLPLTGKHTNLGESMLKAAQMALFDLGHSNFEIIPRDTQGDPEIARQAAKEAVKDGTQIILGPVFAASAKAVKPIVQAANINMITFSTDWTIAGQNAYVMGFSPFDQVERVISYASSRGLKEIGALTPATPYGDAVLSAYRRSAAQNGISKVETTRFNPQAGNVATTLRAFTRFDQRQNEAQNKISIIGGGSIQSAPQPALPYDAVFMPVGGNLARSISNLLNQYDLPPSKIKRLGTGLWDDPSLATESAMDGAWFASPDPRTGDKFRAKFSGIYGYVPPRLTTLAYDATALAGVLAYKGLTRSGKPAFDYASITNANGFAGIDGIFRFNSNGVVERGLAILEYKRAQIRVIDPAPTTFIKPQTYAPAATQPQQYGQPSSGNHYKF